jgi:hypothetical protein
VENEKAPEGAGESVDNEMSPYGGYDKGTMLEIERLIYQSDVLDIRETRIKSRIMDEAKRQVLLTAIQERRCLLRLSLKKLL